MKLTNNQNLPSPLVARLSRHDYHNDGDTSVTQLVSPPRIVQLRKRHQDEITQDVSDLIFAVMGEIGHKILEEYDTPDSIAEERLYLTVQGWKVGAKPDLWHEPHTIDDYKFCSYWTWVFGLKEEWEKQINLYALFYREAGFPVKQGRIIAIFRDWSKRQARIKSAKDYPNSQVKALGVPLWKEEAQRWFLEERILLHQQAELLPDDLLPLCSPEERWVRGEKWAVMKKGRKKAVRVFEDPNKAQEYIDNQNKDLFIEHRSGESVRCEDYCEVQPFCNQYKEGK
jgi:hypothetical protein